MTILDTSKTVAVIGAGTMGAGVAQVAAKAGHPVLLFDVAEGAAEKGIAGIDKGLSKLVDRGRMTAEDKDALLARITPAADLQALAPSALVIEAIVERLDIKQSLFKQLEEICGEEVILASNTSSLSITAIGSDLARPERLLGMHFFNPAPIMKLVEVISGLATDKQLAEDIFETATAWGKHVVHAKSTPGFIVNRVARPFYAEGLRVLQEGGADAATIDAIMRESGGFRMGPFELMDLIGHDVNFAVTSSVHDAFFGDQRFLPSLIQKELVDGGYLGRKSGRGFFEYGENARPPLASTSVQLPPAKEVTLVGDAPFADALVEMLTEADIKVTREEGEELYILAGEAVLALTDGRMATVRSLEIEEDNLVLFDLALDYKAAKRIAIAPAKQASVEAENDATAIFQIMGKNVTVMDDVAGMCVMRTVCMLANEGADAVNQQVCNEAAVDVAMKGGVNYPQGPLAWADAMGLPVVLTALDNLAQNYGEDRYRASPLLLRNVAAAVNFHG